MTPLHGFPEDVAAPIAEALLSELRIPPTELSTATTAGILDAQAGLAARLRAAELPGLGRVPFPFVPMTGGDLLPRPAFDAIAGGAAADVPLVIGCNRDECTLYELMAELLGTDENVAPLPWQADLALQERIHQVYERHREPGCPISTQTSMDTDRIFRIPALRLAEAHRASGGATRVYRFDWRSPTLGGRAGASHGAEVPFVFGDFTMPITEMLVGDDPPRALIDAIHHAWLSFASSGDPAGTGAIPNWPEYDQDGRATMIFGETTAVVSDPDGEQRASWDGVALGT